MSLPLLEEGLTLRAFLLLLLLACRASATTCAAGSYSYSSGICAACPSGASFVAATGLCAPAAAPSDTAFYLSGSQAEGVAAFPGAPVASFTTGVFGEANSALSFASGASYLRMTPAAGSLGALSTCRRLRPNQLLPRFLPSSLLRS